MCPRCDAVYSGGSNHIATFQGIMLPPSFFLETEGAGLYGK